MCGAGLGRAGPALKESVSHHFFPPARPVCYDTTSFALALGHRLCAFRGTHHSNSREHEQGKK